MDTLEKRWGKIEDWWPRLDSNQRLPPYRDGALPAKLRGHVHDGLLDLATIRAPMRQQRGASAALLANELPRNGRWVRLGGFELPTARLEDGHSVQLSNRHKRWKQ